MTLCVKISNQFPFQMIEGWALIRGVGTYSRGAPVRYFSAEGGRLIEGAHIRRVRLIEALRNKV